MQISRPKTLLSMTLIGLGLVTLPLLIGVGKGVMKMNDLMEESRLAVIASADSARANERIALALPNIRRQALLYRAYANNPDERALALERFRNQAGAIDEGLTELGTLDLNSQVNEPLALLGTELDLLNDSLTEAGITDELIHDRVDVMAAAANATRESMRDAVRQRIDALEADTREAQESLAWQAAALIPGTFILVLLFLLLVGRPMRQVDRAIRELGKGDFSHPIAVSGPSDIETLGRQLEWLRLRLAESTEEKNKFLRHMSHELKTPLANIREGTELLLDGSVGELDRQQEEVTGILRENSLKLQQLIENLLTFSAWQAKTAALDVSQFELKPLVFSALSQHRLVISNRGIKLKLNVAPVAINADEGKLRLVLENLVSNAIKFTPQDGQIWIRAEREGDELAIEIEDSGPGIAEEDRDRIFEAFFQGRRLQGGQVGGTGIGLSVVMECVQAHGGTIQLLQESDLGGAHFLARLPLRRAQDKPQLMVANA